MTSTNKQSPKEDITHSIIPNIQNSTEKKEIGKDKTKCYYCERQLKYPDPIRKSPLFRTRDHVIPQSRGGTGKPENIVYCCSKCNNSKANRSLWQWECFLDRIFTNNWYSNDGPWKSRIPIIIENIRAHPLYQPELIFTPTRKLKITKVVHVIKETPVVKIDLPKEINTSAPNFHEDCTA